jgi:TonB family protein
VGSVASQSPNDQDEREELEPVLISPTDWESLKSVEMIEDDCDFVNESESVESAARKPETTSEARSIIVADGCPGMAKVLAAYKPCYPGLAKRAKISGPVSVLVVVDEGGFVIWARALGNPLLQPAAIRAARKWRFEPARCSDGFQRVNRIINFTFEIAK